MTSLIPVERQRLQQLEDTIDRGMKSFVEVGEALKWIRDDRLYRETHNTFEDYCRERWDMPRQHAYRLIGASDVVGNLSPIGDRAPANEAQARPLAKLHPEQQREAWAEVCKLDGPITAGAVDAVVQRIAPASVRNKKRFSSVESTRFGAIKAAIAPFKSALSGFASMKSTPMSVLTDLKTIRDTIDSIIKQREM